MTDPNFGYITPENISVFTDLYELTMMQGYFLNDHNPRATFSLFFRDLPPNRGYIVAAGLEQTIHCIESLSFSSSVIELLAEQGFQDTFLDFLEELSFSGDVRAVPEGTLVFPNEPLIEVTAPIIEAQLFETILLNQVGYQSLIATKASRMSDAVYRFGDQQSLVDFGSRRAHGTDAGVKAARAAYIGGFDGSSNVAACDQFGIPLYGTMAHSWIQSFPTEREAFEAFIRVYENDSILLIDTYDTINGAKLALDVSNELGVDIAGVRLDSGDLIELSKQVADLAGSMDIIVSSGVDEFMIKNFFENNGIATGFGPGTALVTSNDAPSLDIVYKLVEIEQNGRMEPSMKLSTGKVTYPNAKSIHRTQTNGVFQEDIIGLDDESLDGSELLTTVFDTGELVYSCPDLPAIQKHATEQVQHLPEPYRELEDPREYPVTISDRLQAVTREYEHALGSAN